LKTFFQPRANIAKAGAAAGAIRVVHDRSGRDKHVAYARTDPLAAKRKCRGVLGGALMRESVFDQSKKQRRRHQSGDINARRLETPNLFGAGTHDAKMSAAQCEFLADRNLLLTGEARERAELNREVIDQFHSGRGLLFDDL
jgi:hypothetical protein